MIGHDAMEFDMIRAAAGGWKKAMCGARLAVNSPFWMTSRVGASGLAEWFATHRQLQVFAVAGRRYRALNRRYGPRGHRLFRAIMPKGLPMQQTAGVLR